MMATKSIVMITALMMVAGTALAAGNDQGQKANPTNAAAITNNGDSGMPGSGMQMNEQMHKMRAQMAEIHRTKDPAKRAVLIREHMAAMQKMMGMMDGMHSGKSMMGRGGMMEVMDHQKMMEKRMNMMQMMMEQMMQNQAAAEETQTLRGPRHEHRDNN
ncbi:MAG: hypothetical protein B7Z66_09330 [Chromatiales bacterium 21-64-14]|nr:MAG: hypothetical protein B7Z66_09330 [Chromatiales bacterium 21-64-14]HQU16191.1 hypothetical protein [Gammaproteobacteria bacterium]